MRHALHAGLFLLTCLTTWLAGGPVFAATLMSILLVHEMGHYVTARRHGVDVSLPYFIPVPFAIGTLGALIRMRSPITRRDALVDVGASGPLAGLALAIPLLIIGLAQSPVGVAPPGAGAGFIEGNSLLYILLKLLVKGRYLPSGAIDVQLGPMATAAWVGLLVTFINLIPVGQLDGGHVAYAFLGGRRRRRRDDSDAFDASDDADDDPVYNRWARAVHRGLALVGLGVCLFLANQARAAGHGLLWSLGYGAKGGLPWAIWALLLLLMHRLQGKRWHPPLSAPGSPPGAPTAEDPLSPSRRAIGWLVAGLFVLIFTPIPMREALLP
jgi:membrane-associated protease RseP (regulator of RpoE activity)